MNQPSIDGDKAIEIAKLAASDRGYPWIKPFDISEHGDELHVSDNQKSWAATRS